MNIGTAKTLTEAAQSLQLLRNCQPYRFGGKWFLAVLNGEAVAYRSASDLRKRMTKEGTKTAECAVIG